MVISSRQPHYNHFIFNGSNKCLIILKNLKLSKLTHLVITFRLTIFPINNQGRQLILEIKSAPDDHQRNIFKLILEKHSFCMEFQRIIETAEIKTINDGEKITFGDVKLEIDKSYSISIFFDNES